MTDTTPMPAGADPRASEPPRAEGEVRVRYEALVDVTAGVLAAHGVPAARARTAAVTLCYGDLTGMRTHGLVNLSRLYLPLFADGRVNPAAEPRCVADAGAAARYDADRALGLWAASEAMDRAVARAAAQGVGLVTMSGATHIGCAGVHARRAVDHDMIGIVVTNCGRQRIAPPPDGRRAMLGTNPLSVAAPAGGHPPFVLDMSTTAVPTGRVRAAARSGASAPPGWLAGDDGSPVTDPAAYDRGEARLLWLGGAPETGGYKGFGLGLLVEVLAALVPGAGIGPAPEALAGTGGPSGRDDDIGVTAIAIAPGRLRGVTDVASDAASLFGSLLACPPRTPDRPVRYPGWHEARAAERNTRDGVPLPAALYAEVCDIAAGHGLRPPAPAGGSR